MVRMSSGEAHGWLFVGLINDHLRERWREDIWGDRMPEGATSYCPQCCGPCGTLRDYWNTTRGRAEAQTYVNALSRVDRGWSWCPNGVIDWEQIEADMANGWCPDHEGEEQG